MNKRASETVITKAMVVMTAICIGKERAVTSYELIFDVREVASLESSGKGVRESFVA